MKHKPLGSMAGLLLAACVAAAAQTIPPVGLSEAWAVVILPAVPLTLTVQGKRLWVAGADEMIAESDDGGAHWSVRHLHDRGELLQVITFVNDKIGIALGTDNSRLRTTDGGSTWNSLNVPTGPIEGWSLAAFVDEKNGIVADGTRFAVTHDAGVHWLERFVDAPGGRGPTQAPLQVGILDPGHAFAILPGNPSNDLGAGIVYTSDGGKTWREDDQPPARTLAGLRSDGNSIWVYGVDRNSGETATPVAVVTHDGEKWQHAEVDAPLGPCVDTSCHTGGGWREFTSDQPAQWFLPVASIFGPSVWAAAQGSYCEIEYHQLQCVKGSAEPVKNRPARAGAPEVKLPTCGPLCSMPPRPSYINQQQHFGPVQMLLAVDREGKVVDVGVMSSPWWDTAQWVRGAARNWRFQPGTVAGKPTAMEVAYMWNVW